MTWQKFKSPAKVGTALVLSHFILCAGGYLADFFPGTELEKPLIYSAISLAAPVYLLSYYAHYSFEIVKLHETHLLTFMLVVVGPAWLFLLGSAVATAAKPIMALGRAGFLTTTAVSALLGGLYLASVQLAVTLPHKAWDGCGYAGLPVRFFSDCSWTGLSFSPMAFALNGTVWLAIGVTLGLVTLKQVVNIDTV